MEGASNTNDLKMDIISLVTKIDDVDKLKIIYKKAEQLNQKAKSNKAFEDSSVEVDENISFQELLDEQDYKQISYEQFRKLADRIEWEHSLEELLEALD